MTRLLADTKNILTTIGMFKVPVKKSFLYIEYQKHFSKSDIDYFLKDLLERGLIKEVTKGEYNAI
jgi:hypothetical protein